MTKELLESIKKKAEAKDSSASIDWYQKAAKQGHKGAQVILGRV